MADGGYFSDYYLHLYEPNQKAVVSWDGKTETMILSAAVKSDDIANFVWIIPIQSSSKPIVTEGNISVFRDLVDYFQPKYDYGKGVTTGGTGGVEVIESKEIDIYDITILKATNAEDLIEWLNNNGYKVPKEIKSVIEKYVNKGNFYFIANKIDLRNKYDDKTIRERYDWFINDSKSYGYSGFSLMGNYAEFKKILTYNILCNYDFTGKFAPEYFDVFFYFAKLGRLEKLGINKSEVINLVQKYGVNDSFCDSLKSNPNQVGYITPPNEDLKRRYESIHEEISQKLDSLNDYFLLINDKLANGMSTPLKFEFQPTQPYYPLEISNINTGYSNIEVYVITNNPVKDMNEILDIDKSKEISSDLKEKLEKYIDLKEAGYVTRLTYRGNLDNLNDDAIFVTEITLKSLGENCRKDEECTSGNCDQSWSICCKYNTSCYVYENQTSCYNKCTGKEIPTTTTVEIPTTTITTTTLLTTTIQQTTIEPNKPNFFVRTYRNILEFFRTLLKK